MNLFDQVFNSDELQSFINDTTHNLKLHTAHSNKDLSNLLIQFTNCRLFFDNKIVKDDLWIRNGIIQNPRKIFFEEKKQADVKIDLNGLLISPGFIDVQINGGFGRDFTMDTNIEECLNEVSKGLLEYGVTAFCPTIISSDSSNYKNLLPKIRDYMNKKKSCNKLNSTILGLHLEGPFINKEKLGAHDINVLKTFDNGIKTLEEIYGMEVEELRNFVSILTMAPELDPSNEVVKRLTDNGIIVSLGHSKANLKQGENAVVNGATFITHLFNAMLPFHHRDPHLIGLLSNFNLESHIFYGVISDGIHTHPSAINIAYKSHPNGLVLVTDAMSAMGLEDGRVHHIGSQAVQIIKDPLTNKRSAYLQGTTTLCGSVATMDDCVRNLISSTECSLVEALKCATEHPAKLLGIYPLNGGSLNYGAKANFTVIDDNITVKATFINGDLAWSSSDWSPLFKFKFIP